MAAVIVLLMCSLSSSILGGLYSGGFIPMTGPKAVKDSGLDKIMSYFHLVDTFIAEFGDIDTSDEKGVEQFEKALEDFSEEHKDELKDLLCEDLAKLQTYAESHGDENVLTLTGTKPFREFAVDYMGGQESSKKINMLEYFKKCERT